jgi:hypothetical protein
MEENPQSSAILKELGDIKSSLAVSKNVQAGIKDSIHSTEDHDLLIKLHENIDLNFRQVKADIKDLKDGTSNQLNDHEARIKDLEVTRVDFRAKIRDNGKYMVFIVALGLLILGLLIWHITGGSGGYHI